MDGSFPFVLLQQADGNVWSRSSEFVRKGMELLHESRSRDAVSRITSQTQNAKSIEEFRSNSRYEGDGNRIDLAYAVYAAAHGISEDEIAHQLRSRDLTHKGSQTRQADYIARTIRKAMGRIQPDRDR